MQRQGPEHYDLIVIGGGIYGIVLTLEASLLGLQVLLLERNDWGSGTSYNWLRILHGGLRYLQSADLPRFYESVRERKWYLEHFPEFVEPLPCIMPLYSTGSRSPHVMRAAIAVNHLLSLHRNRGLPPTHFLPAGGVLDKEGVRAALPFVDTEDLRNGVLWYDAIVTEPQCLLIEMLHWARHSGARALNYCEVTEVRRVGKLLVVRGRNERGGGAEFTAPMVFNATGHGVFELAKRAGLLVERERRCSWAWNVLFDIPNRALGAAAVTARRAGAQTFFVLPWRGRTLVGTGHALALDEGEQEARQLPEALVEKFVDAVHEAVPQLSIKDAARARVFSGWLPMSTHSERLSSRPALVDHRAEGWNGLYSIWGVKYTTARACAKRLLRMALGPRFRKVTEYRRPTSRLVPAEPVGTSLHSFNKDPGDFAQRIAALDAVGDVRHLDDLVLRRSGVGDLPGEAVRIAPQLLKLLPWSEERKRSELERLLTVLGYTGQENLSGRAAADHD